MAEKLTVEKMIELGNKWGKAYLESLSIEERLAGLTPEELLSGLTLEERLAGLTHEEREAVLQPEVLLAGLSPETIENYLRKLKEKPSDEE